MVVTLSLWRTVAWVRWATLCVLVPVMSVDPPAAAPLARQSLADYLQAGGRCSVCEAVAVVADVLYLLHRGHTQGRIHTALGLEQVTVDTATLQVLELQGWIEEPLLGEPAAALAQGVVRDVQAAARLLQALLHAVVPEQVSDSGEALQDVDEQLQQLLHLLQRAQLRAIAPASPALASAQGLRNALQAWECQGVLQVPSDQEAALQALLQRMGERSDFQALTQAVLRIQQVTDSEDDSLSDLTNEILKDAALTRNLLCLVNSPYYARPGRAPVSTVARAVSLVGFRSVRTMALGLVLLDHLHDRSQVVAVRDDTLRTMLAGAMARELCQAPHQDEHAFLGAMFQDLGRLLCASYFTQESQQIQALEASGHYGGNEQWAALQVLGCTLEAVSLGVARLWLLPANLQRCLRLPLGSPMMRAPVLGEERLRWVARAANEAASTLLLLEPEPAERTLRRLAAQYARILSLSPQAVDDALRKGRHYFSDLALALELPQPYGVGVSRLLRHAPTQSGLAPLREAQEDDVLVSHALRTAGANPLPVVVRASVDHPPAAETVAQMLAAGVQDVADALAGRPQRQQVLRMIVETIYRALGVQRVVLALRDSQGEWMNGRFGLGSSSDALVHNLHIPLADSADLFAAVCQRGADTLIADATQPRTRERLPAWYRERINAPSFLLLPVQWQGQPLGLLYADHAQPGAIQVDERCMDLLRTLRSQTLMALRLPG